MLDKTTNGGAESPASVGMLPDLSKLSIKDLATLDMALKAASDAFVSVENMPRCKGDIGQIVFELAESCNRHRETLFSEVLKRGYPADHHQQDAYVALAGVWFVEREEYAEAMALLSAHMANGRRS